MKLNFSNTHPLKRPHCGRWDTEEQQGKLPARQSSASNNASLKTETMLLTELNWIIILNEK